MVHHLITDKSQQLKAPYLKLYSVASPNGVKVTILLELLGLEYYVQKIDLNDKAEQKEPWFLKMNPNGKVPTLETVNRFGESTYISESAAILFYLADTYDLKRKFSLGGGSPFCYEQLEWVFFQSSELGPTTSQLFQLISNSPEKVDDIKKYHDKFVRLLGVLEEKLKRTGTGFIVDEHLTLADIAIFPWLGLTTLPEKLTFTEEIKQFPLVEGWIKRIQGIEEVSRAQNIPPR
ncbi:unnamed protein product [Ambrosiozyma monospora]|uniref:Unnamed protein product n=1 Tax=Ambrosiozyma monospora TaxID=43982 RepID=A0ACB5SQV6_AMBMO|nr:unnamed protein product [Ambrosiozyma monospora]